MKSQPHVQDGTNKSAIIIKVSQASVRSKSDHVASLDCKGLSMIHHFVLISHVHVLLHTHFKQHFLLGQVLLLRGGRLLLTLHFVLLHLDGCAL